MDLRRVNLIIFVVCSVYLMRTFALPRHSSAVIKSGESSLPAKLDSVSKVESTPETKIPGRIWCQYEEATEDVVCQEHCLPKGYTYGICVSNTCVCL